jgi:hypothetical protein
MISAPRQVGETHLAKKLISKEDIGGGGMIIFDMGMVFQDLKSPFARSPSALTLKFSGAYSP